MAFDLDSQRTIFKSYLTDTTIFAEPLEVYEPGTPDTDSPDRTINGHVKRTSRLVLDDNGMTETLVDEIIVLVLKDATDGIPKGATGLRVRREAARDPDTRTYTYLKDVDEESKEKHRLAFERGEVEFQGAVS